VGEKDPTERKAGPRQWTGFLGRIMDEVGKKMNCSVVRRRQEPEDKELSGEYLNIDVVFIDNAEYDLNGEERKGDPFVLPRAVVELENRYDPWKISYCLWKILCLRAPIRALVCLQESSDKVAALKQQLENVIWQGSLTKGTDGDLFVIIGDESVGTEAPWRDYFSVYEWRNDRLEKIEGLEW
jgi:hypothetical protein